MAFKSCQLFDSMATRTSYYSSCHPAMLHFGNKVGTAVLPAYCLNSCVKESVEMWVALAGGFASGTLVQGGPACSFAAPAMSYYGLPPTKFANEYNEFEKLLRVPLGLLEKDEASG